jgi:sulfur-oxidizing protein SoxZ
MKATLDPAAHAHVVKAIITHPMETGQRKDPKTGALIPPHFIQEVVCELNGRPVLTANWGTAIARDPYLSFQLRDGKAGDKLTLRWVDNKGNTETSEPLTLS